MRVQIIALLVSALAIQLLNCNNETSVSKSIHMNGTISFIAGDVRVNDKKTGVGTQVSENDTIKTGDKSMVVIQFSQTSVITVKSDTVLKIDKLLNAGVNGESNATVGVSLVRGEALNKVLVRGTNYSVGTPTMVAAVRGTTFQVRLRDEVSRVDLLEGELKIRQLSGEGKDMEFVLTAGHYIISTKDKITRPAAISKKDRERLIAFNDTRIVPDIDKVSPGTEIKNEENGKVYPGTENKKDENVKGDDLNSGRIKKKTDDGILSVIRLKDGREYLGTFSQNGDSVEIIMTGGRLKVPATEIKDITRYRK